MILRALPPLNAKSLILLTSAPVRVTVIPSKAASVIPSTSFKPLMVTTLSPPANVTVPFIKTPPAFLQIITFTTVKGSKEIFTI